MTIKRKEVIREKKEKAMRRVRPKKVNLQILQDAIIDGKWSVTIGQDFLVSRQASGRQIQSICTFNEMINEKTVNSWDKTLEHWYAFDIDDLERYGIVVKKF